MPERKETPQERYHKAHTQSVAIRLMKNTEQDIIQKLASVPNKAGYIKSLIRQDIQREKEDMHSYKAAMVEFREDPVTFTLDEVEHMINITPQIVSAVIAPNRYIRACFSDGSARIYDMNPLLDNHPAFVSLAASPQLLQKVTIDAGGHGLSWTDDIDLAAEEIWNNGTPD